jgi:hypothetical protein
MRLIGLFKRDVWALDRRARSRLSACWQCSVSVARKMLTALSEQRGQDEQGGSRDSDALAGSA